MTILLLRIINPVSDCMLADMRRFAFDLIFTSMIKEASWPLVREVPIIQSRGLGGTTTSKARQPDTKLLNKCLLIYLC